MIIKKFQGKTETEAVNKVKEEMGNEAVVMNIKKIRPSGIFRFFKGITYEVTAALEENSQEEEPVVREREPVVKKVRTAPVQKAEILPEEKKEEEQETLKDRLDALQLMLEKRLGDEEEQKQEQDLKEQQRQEAEKRLPVLRILYQIMLDNEVNEVYANQIIDEIEKMEMKNPELEQVLSTVYQKMILKFGPTRVIELEDHPRKPKVVFFFGPTGVGKTTTIAKIASKFKVEQGRKVALLTSDTYRIAAVEQLRTYANILEAPLTIIYSAEDLNKAFERFSDADVILIDTAGHSHKNEQQKQELIELLKCANDYGDVENYLVLSATTKFKDLKSIVDAYRELSGFKVIFTKLDETSAYGNLLNIKLYAGVDIAYTTNGQNVPDDMQMFDTQQVVKQLLGGR